ncbi:MAG: SpoIIE family protein phosphatase [Saccharofermentanales bacterium]|jgi:sigma-B regulation protein RsbU (phosphoserine phosphatase)
MKKSYKLSNKLIVGFVLLGILICAVSIVISYFKYRATVGKKQNDVAYRIANVGLSYVDGDDIERYLETGQTDEAYEIMGRYLSELRANMNVNHLFIAKLEGIELTYIFDADNPADEFEPFRLGDKGKINAKFEKDIGRIANEGVRVDNYFYSRSEFGYNTSAIVPVYNSQDVIVAILVVEISMGILQSILTEFVVFITAASVLIIGIFIAVYLTYLQRKVVLPIQIMTDETDAFIKNEAEVSERLSSIVTGDEIERLAGAIYKMQVDIKEYIHNQMSVAVERERIVAELDIARQIQTGMLPCSFPAFPDIREIDLYASMVPARRVGGDFYDFFMVDDHKLCFVIADVSGKGIPAALFMMMAKILIKNQALAGLLPAEIFSKVNNQLCENNDANMFVTAWMGIYDIRSGSLASVNAGHNPPLLCHRDGRFEFFKVPSNFVLGGMEDISYQSTETQLSAGDTLFLHTDGVTEATTDNLEIYGEKRLQIVLNRLSGGQPQEILEGVTADLQLFVKDSPQFDDITMLALKIMLLKPPSLTVTSSAENFAEMRSFIDDTLEKTGCSEKVRTQFLIASDEILSNIFLYSKSNSVTVEIKTDEDETALTFSDDGIPFDPLKIEDPDIYLPAEEREPGGLGIFITKKLMDEVIYEYPNQKNTLTIRKKTSNN